MKWRKWNNIIHRDLGYLCFGLTLVYAISGVAVNHIGDWNPNYRIDHIESMLNPAELNELQGEALIQYILHQLHESRKIKSSFYPGPETLNIFVAGNTVSVNLTTGHTTQEKAVSRPIIYEMNFLHLNHPKKLWTWFADLYSLSLITVCITGLFVLRGKKGISGRGAFLASAGVIIPVFFLFLYR